MVSTLAAGSHSLTAVYGASSSSKVTQVVNRASTTTSLTSLAAQTAFGQSVTFTATIAPATATGTVMFKEGSTTLGTSPLSGGQAILTVTTLAAGQHLLTAAYSGDSNDTASTSNVLTQTVNGVVSAASCAPGFSYVSGQGQPSPVTCQFGAIAPAAFTVTTTAPWLVVNPPSGQLGPVPSLFAISVAPSGLTAGSYSGSFTIGGPQLGSLTIPVQLAVTTGSTGTLVATPLALFFTYQLGANSPPSQTLTVSSTNGTQLPFSVSADGGAWLNPGVNLGTTPQPFNVIVNPIGLGPNTYTGRLTISSPGVPPVEVDVTLTVTAQGTPQLGVDSSPVNLSGLQGGRPASAQIQVANAGGNILAFMASTSSGAWLNVSPASGSIDNSTPASLTVTADPTSLAVGTYQGAVTVVGPDRTATIPVTFSVTSSSPVILLSQAGLSFTAALQGGAPLPQQIGILNVGNGSVDWSATASTLSGGNWLQLSTTGGTVQQPYLDVSLTNVSIDPTVLATLTPGDYYGQIQVTGQAVNSPQLVTVILTVLAAGLDPGPEVHPSSIIFTGDAGVSPDAQNVTIGIRKPDGDQFISGHIGNSYSYSPNSTMVLPNQPVSLQVVPDFSALAPAEIDRGTITLQFSDGTVRVIGLLTVVAPSDAGSSRLGAQATSSCSTLNLQWRTPSPPNFTVGLGRAQTLELQIVDNCGNLIIPKDATSASVQATFSNKDADLRLVHVGNGVWTGTWKPVNPSPGPVAVAVTAFNSTASVLQSGQSSPLFATVVPGNTPLVTAGGVQQAASYVLGAPIAPGTLITLKGLNLADADSATSDQPLPTLWNGTQVFLGTEALPLLYAGMGQVNVQVPYDVPVNTPFQVTVQRDNVQSLPEQLVIAPAQPGIFTADKSGAGQGVIYRSDGSSLAQPGSPATAGEMISIYCTGLGTVTPPVPAGTPPPDSPVSVTDNAVTVTIGGQDGQATVGTLVPGQPGVYRVLATVPAGVSGDTLPVVVTVAGQASPAVVTMAVQ
jgi:uncharacterized protein (TIGR03437 family)